ncbi:UPF0102 protein [Synergistales bacterium]|nr:UPF0102 protein [Synergistales bacterium]
MNALADTLPPHLTLGRKAEDAACSYIRDLGWNVLARNFLCKRGELDIVAMDEREKELVVVEVRCRTNGKFQLPEESVSQRKLRSLVFAARIYVDRIKWDGPWRIDIVGIIASPGTAEDKWRISHIRGVRV